MMAGASLSCHCQWQWLCAVVRVLTIASGPGCGHRPQPARAGAPRPIPDHDAHIRDCSLHWVPSTGPYNTTVCRSMGRAGHGGIVKSLTRRLSSPPGDGNSTPSALFRFWFFLLDP
jgi:hypothetical protein